MGLRSVKNLKIPSVPEGSPANGLPILCLFE
jgi:hypothetical protein